MLLLLQLSPDSSDSPFASDAAERTRFRLEVKKRLFNHNKDQLNQLDGGKAEMKEKLDETWKGVVASYQGLTKRFRRE